MFKENDYTNMHKKINNIEVDSEPLNPGGHETLILDQNELIDIKIAPGEGTQKFGCLILKQRNIHLKRHTLLN